MSAAAAAPAQATARDGNCESSEFCYYYNSNNQGSVSDFTTSVEDYGTTTPSCYVFKGPGAGQYQCIKNNAASVWNRSTVTVRVYYNSNYGGTYMDVGPGYKGQLSAALYNNNASHQFNPTSDGGGFYVPFPCGESWLASTRTNHSPTYAVDFNHYPEDNGWRVYASAPGTVTTVRDLGGTSYGKYIVISHANGWTTYYAHLSAFNVSVGQSVNERTFIGRVGNTGGSTGPHLHYEQRQNGYVKQITFNSGNPVYFGDKYLSRTSSCP